MIHVIRRTTTFSQIGRGLLVPFLLATVFVEVNCLGADLGTGKEPSSMGGYAAASPNKDNSSDEHNTSHVSVVPLQKQYVPVSKDGKIVAYKTAYFGHIQVGKPNRQNFTVVFDTGSGHLILPSKKCTSETCMKHFRYDSLMSDTAVDIDHTGQPLSVDTAERDQCTINFGTGNVTGEFMSDIMCLGRMTDDCVTLRTVAAFEMSAEPFGRFDFDGVLGLGLTALTLTPEFSFFGQMVAQHPEMQSRFAVFLSRTDEGRSAIGFGGHEEQWAASDILWTPVAMQELGYWQVQIKSVRIGDEVLDDCADGGCRAILDTGTSLLGVPRQIARIMTRLLARPVPGDPGDPSRSEADCRSVPGKLLHFDMGGPVVSLDAEDYSRPSPFNITVPNSDQGWELFCRSLLLPLDMPPPVGPRVFIWGEPVLRKYLTVYDWGRKQIGFANAGTSSKGTAEHSGATTIGSPPKGSLLAGTPLAAKNLQSSAVDNSGAKGGNGVSAAAPPSSAATMATTV